MQHITDDERRARLARRHGLAPGQGYGDVAAATEAMTALHATEAATVHLSLWARVPGVTIDDVDRALYDDRSVVKQLAMRRTLFGFGRHLLPAVWGASAARVAAQQHKQVVKFVTEGGIADDPEAWVAEACEATLAALADGEPRTTARLRELVPALDVRFTIGKPGKKWGGQFPIGRWVVGTLGARGKVLRATNAGHWRLNKPAWTLSDNWLGEHVEPLTEADGYAELVRRWLWTFGPGTESDIVWWLGATKTAVRKALATVGATEVALDGGQTGWVLADDLDLDPEPREPVAPWGALLPTLDPTVMGWKQRDFYLDASHTPYLFDTNGNAGNTAWWDGRIVGAWAQDGDGKVHLLLRSDIGRDGEAVLAAKAEQLTEWLDGTRIVNPYASPQMKGARLS